LVAEVLVRFRRSLLHTQHEVFPWSEIQGLIDHREASFFQRPSYPFCPGFVRFREADKKPFICLLWGERGIVWAFERFCEQIAYLPPSLSE
jgi:hypothetical protein